jgi:hypothetical protein
MAHIDPSIFAISRRKVTATAVRVCLAALCQALPSSRVLGGLTLAGATGQGDLTSVPGPFLGGRPSWSVLDGAIPSFSGSSGC